VRIELEKPSPDMNVARAGFLAGQNHPDDIDGIDLAVSALPPRQFSR